MLSCLCPHSVTYVFTLELQREEHRIWELQGVSDMIQFTSPFYTCELCGRDLSEAITKPAPASAKPHQAHAKLTCFSLRVMIFMMIHRREAAPHISALLQQNPWKHYLYLLPSFLYPYSLPSLLRALVPWSWSCGIYWFLGVTKSKGQFLDFPISRFSIHIPLSFPFLAPVFLASACWSAQGSVSGFPFLRVSASVA